MGKDCLGCNCRVVDPKTNWGYCANILVIQQLIQEHRMTAGEPIPSCLVARTYSCTGEDPEYYTGEA